jgi:hypothetical protein
MEVELEELKNINEFNDEILYHKEDDIHKLAQKCQDLSQMNSQLMTRLEIINRELNALKIATEGSIPRVKLDQHRQGRETVQGLYQYVDLRVRRCAIMMRFHAEQTHSSRGAGTDLLKGMIGFGVLANCSRTLS